MNLCHITTCIGMYEQRKLGISETISHLVGQDGDSASRPYVRGKREGTLETTLDMGGTWEVCNQSFYE